MSKAASRPCQHPATARIKVDEKEHCKKCQAILEEDGTWTPLHDRPQELSFG